MCRNVEGMYVLGVFVACSIAVLIFLVVLCRQVQAWRLPGVRYPGCGGVRHHPDGDRVRCVIRLNSLLLACCPCDISNKAVRERFYALAARFCMKLLCRDTRIGLWLYSPHIFIGVLHRSSVLVFFCFCC